MRFTLIIIGISILSACSKIPAEVETIFYTGNGVHSSKYSNNNVYYVSNDSVFYGTAGDELPSYITSLPLLDYTYTFDVDSLGMYVVEKNNGQYQVYQYKKYNNFEKVFLFAVDYKSIRYLRVTPKYIYFSYYSPITQVLIYNRETQSIENTILNASSYFFATQGNELIFCDFQNYVSKFNPETMQSTNIYRLNDASSISNIQYVQNHVIIQKQNSVFSINCLDKNPSLNFILEGSIDWGIFNNELLYYPRQYSQTIGGTFVEPVSYLYKMGVDGSPAVLLKSFFSEPYYIYGLNAITYKNNNIQLFCDGKVLNYTVD